MRGSNQTALLQQLKILYQMNNQLKDANTLHQLELNKAIEQKKKYKHIYQARFQKINLSRVKVNYSSHNSIDSICQQIQPEEKNQLIQSRQFKSQVRVSDIFEDKSQKQNSTLNSSQTSDLKSSKQQLGKPIPGDPQIKIKSKINGFLQNSCIRQNTLVRKTYLQRLMQIQQM